MPSSSTSSTSTPTLDAVTTRAVDVVGPCAFSAITLRRAHGQLETVAPTSPLAVRCDELQGEVGEGPCVTAVWEGDAHQLVADTTDAAWPLWGRRVAELGVGSVLTLRLSSPGGVLGALNLYAGTPHAFDAESVDVAEVFAVHAASAIATGRLVAGLRTALASRHLIGLAQGRLMQEYAMSQDAAFEVLRRYSSQLNRKLRDVARVVVDTGRLPDLPE